MLRTLEFAAFHLILVLVLASGCATPAPHEDLAESAPAQPDAVALAGEAPDASGGSADQAAGTNSGTQDPADEPWLPPVPVPESHDWIRLTSGEWLKGEVIEYYHEDLQFDSDKLNELTLDWEDVVELRGPRSFTCLLDDRSVIIGTVHVRDDLVLISGEETLRIERKRLLRMVPGRPQESNYWSGDIGIGMTVRRGNTDQSDLTTTALITRRTASTRLEFNFAGTVSQADDVEIANNHRLTGRWNVYLGPRVYLTPLAFEAIRDPFTNTDLRFTPSTGAGYRVIDRQRVEWEVDAAIGYQYTRFTSVEEGTEPEESVPAIILGTILDSELTKNTDLRIEYSINIDPSGSQAPNQNGRLTLSTDITAHLEIDYEIFFDRVGSPVADAEGAVPNKNDLRMTLGFSWDF